MPDHARSPAEDFASARVISPRRGSVRAEDIDGPIKEQLSQLCLGRITPACAELLA